MDGDVRCMNVERAVEKIVSNCFRCRASYKQNHSINDS